VKNCGIKTGTKMDLPRKHFCSDLLPGVQDLTTLGKIVVYVWRKENTTRHHYIDQMVNVV
jgi:hypothetical protein